MNLKKLLYLFLIFTLPVKAIIEKKQLIADNQITFEKMVAGLKKDSKDKTSSFTHLLDDFDNQIIKQFYLCANALTKNIFPFASDNQLAKIIPIITNLFEQDPAYYFTDSEKNFFPDKLDAIISELKIYVQALETLKGSPEEDKSQNKNDKELPLLQAWKNNNTYEVYLDLLVVYFGFLNRKLASFSFRTFKDRKMIFNEYFLCYKEIQTIFRKLSVEEKYAEKINDCMKANSRIFKKIEAETANNFEFDETNDNDFFSQ
jgi:hypothetical protein